VTKPQQGDEGQHGQDQCNHSYERGDRTGRAVAVAFAETGVVVMEAFAFADLLDLDAAEAALNSALVNAGSSP